MSNHSGDTRYARYNKFSIANEAAKYQLSVSGYSGNAGDSLSGHNGNYFSTYDRDNDNYAEGSCARQYKAGNWYGRCHASNLNGIYHNGEHTSYADGVNWVTFEGYYYSLKTSTMMVR
ncbi:fibrinogen-related protein [Vibrio splendidus]